MLSAYRLRDIGVALHTCYDTFGRLPPATVTDKEGRPLYSWRVLLLPYLEQGRLYEEFKLDEPWDGPHNRKLAEKTPRCYQAFPGVSDATGSTRYKVFVGPGTAFERPGLTWADFPDGLANTILVVDAGEPVPWSKPDDLAYDPAVPLPPLAGAFRKPAHFLCYEVGRHAGFNAVFADGTPRFLRSTTEEKSLRAVITRDGGEQVDPSRLE